MKQPWLLVLAFASAGCSPDAAPPPAGDLDQVTTAILAADAPETLTYDADLGVNLTEMTRNASGLFWQDMRLGEGDSVGVGQEAVVRYSGWLPDGTPFDSNVEAEPFAFRLGAGSVIQGWDEGVVGMRIGGTRKLVIPSHLGYGPGGAGPIPPNATLVFDVELLGVNP